MTVAVPFRPRTNASDFAAFPASVCLYGRQDDRQDHFELRKSSYEEAGIGFIGPTQDPYDELDSTLLIGTVVDRKLVATMRLNFALGRAEDELPCERYYPEVARIKARSSRPVVEFSRGGIDPSIRNRSYRTTMYASVIRAGVACCIAARVGFVLVATRPKLQFFYEYMLGLHSIAEPAFYPPGQDPVALLGGDFSQADEIRQRHNKFFKIDREEVNATGRALAQVLPVLKLQSQLL